MDSEDRFEQITLCKNVMNSMSDAMVDILNVDDDLLPKVLLSRYRFAKNQLEKEMNKLNELLQA